MSALRDRGAQLALDVQPVEWQEQVHACIANLAAAGGTFTSDDVTRECGDSPTGSKGAMGALFLAASKRGVIRRVGYTQSSRSSGHARALAVWQGDAESAA